MTGGGLGERQTCMHDGAHATVGDHRPHHVPDRVHDRGLLLRRSGAECRTDHRGAAREQQTEVDLAAPPLLEPDHHEPTTGGESAEVRVERAGTQDVEHDVDTPPAGRLENAGEHVLATVVDHHGSAELEAAFRARRTAGRRQDLGAERRRELDGHDFVVGDSLTMADICLLSTVDFAEWIGLPVEDEFENLVAWRARMKARPSANA